MGVTCFFFGYLLKGRSEFEGEQETVHLNPGDLIYIPKGERYISHWEGEGEVALYSLSFDCLYSDEKRYYPLQKISGIPQETFDWLYRLGKENPYRMMGELYFLYDMLLEKMHPGTEHKRMSRLKPALDYLQNHYKESVSVETLSALCCMSQPSFYGEFRKVTGYSPIEYKNCLKCRQAITMLCNTEETVESISEKLNFSSTAHLRRQLWHFYQKTPKEIRKEQMLTL